MTQTATARSVAACKEYRGRLPAMGHERGSFPNPAKKIGPTHLEARNKTPAASCYWNSREKGHETSHNALAMGMAASAKRLGALQDALNFDAIAAAQAFVLARAQGMDRAAKVDAPTRVITYQGQRWWFRANLAAAPQAHRSGTCRWNAEIKIALEGGEPLQATPRHQSASHRPIM